MKIAVVSAHLPHAEGTASGRALLAWCEGVRGLGHDVEVWSWRGVPRLPTGGLPEWCRYEPFDVISHPMWREHLRSVANPRGGIARAGWRPPEGSVAFADDQHSSPAVVPFARSVVTVRHRAVADAIAVRDLGLSDLQEARAERRGARRADLTVVCSDRVGKGLRGMVRVVPIAIRLPPAPVAPVEAPVAALIAHWGWPPNKLALKWLLEDWPQVREASPGARLVLAGRGLSPDEVGTMAGVTVLGEVGSGAEVLAQASVLAFPCPPSSGPKIKVLEALAWGLPVVTTPAGVEGLVLGPGQGAMVVARKDFAPALAGLLGSPERRAILGATGREAISAHHSPLASARARVAALTEAFPEVLP
jgi:glycosyltransferase involved in cell wall biosynthesis